jgi:hypothetical protein
MGSKDQTVLIDVETVPAPLPPAPDLNKAPSIDDYNKPEPEIPKPEEVHKTSVIFNLFEVFGKTM